MKHILPRLMVLVLCLLLLAGMLPAAMAEDGNPGETTVETGTPTGEAGGQNGGDSGDPGSTEGNAEGGADQDTGDADDRGSSSGAYDPLTLKIPVNVSGTYLLQEVENNTGAAPTKETGTFPKADGSENAFVLSFTEPEYHKYELQRTDGDARNNQKYIVEVMVLDDNGQLSNYATDSEGTKTLTMVVYPAPAGGAKVQTGDKIPGIVTATVTLKKLGDEAPGDIATGQGGATSGTESEGASDTSDESGTAGSATGGATTGQKPLAGAVFELYDESALAKDSEGKVTGLKEGAAPVTLSGNTSDGSGDESGTTSTKLTTDENGLLTVGDLQPGVWALKEVTPPVKYRLLEDLIVITVGYTLDAEGNLVPTVELQDNDQVTLAADPDRPDSNRDFVLTVTDPLDWGDLKIVKSVNDTVSGAQYAGTTATFVYRITATFGGEVIFNDIRTITWPAEREILIHEKLLVGSVVTVTEVYTGSRYNQDGNPGIVNSGDTSNATLVITADTVNPATITFTNINDRTDTEGYGILNTFVYDGSGWTNPSDSTQSGGQGSSAEG